MKTRIAELNRVSFRRIATALTIAFLALLVVAIPLPLAAGQADFKILEPAAKHFGMTYGEWSAAWWQWAFSLPADNNPFFDETGCANGGNGQFGPVWFLTGVINTSGQAERTCTMPAGRALFFPVINTECSTIEGNGSTEQELRACTEALMQVVTDVHAAIDGVPVIPGRHDRKFRAASPLFAFGPLPDNNVLQSFGVDAPAGTISRSAADGFYLMVAPLPPGDHTINFGGTFATTPPFTLDITYRLTVVDVLK